MAAGNQMNLGVLVTPYINQQALNGMAAAAGSNFATQFNTAVSRASQPLGRITGQVSEFEKSMAAANARVLAFGASAGSIYLVHDAFKRMVSSTVEVEKALADINIVLGLGQTALKNFSNTMFKAAAETGQTFETASKVALEFARHGVSATETAKRMVSAMQLMRISSLNAGQAVNAITAAINAFNKEGITSEDIVSRMTAVDTKFAVSAQDLARAIERVGSTAVDAGVKFNQLLALVTAVQTATSRGGAVIGNAFKSIFTRLSRPEVLSDLESVGVITKNASGQVLPMIEIMKRLASQYDHLSYAQKSFVSEAVGGVYQVNILKASLADLGRGFSIYDKAVIAASNSSGLIEKRMASLNDTIASKFNQATLKVTEFFATFGQMGFGAGAKKALDSFSSDMDLLIDSLADTTDSDGVGAKIGKSIAQGIVKGMGDIISGPGIQMAAMLTARLTRGLAAFTYKSGREVLGMNEGEHKQAAIQKSINDFLGRNVGLVDAWARGQISLNQLSAVYLKNLQASNILQARMANIGSGAAQMIGGTINYTPAGGYVPSFRIASEDDARTERNLAMAHGYEAGPVVRKVVWDGHGGAQLTSINQRETVAEKMVNGHRGSFVVPPNGFGKGTIYAANGFVPTYSITPEALGSFSSGKELLKYVRSLGMRGSKGSSRMFIPLDENKGVKIAMNKAGIAQNEVEFPILNHDYFAAQQYSDILPKGFGYDENNFLWGIVEKISKGTSKDFQKLTGKVKRDFLRGKLSPVEEQIEDFTGNYGLIKGDFVGGRNVGVGNVPSPQGDLFQPQTVKGIKLFDVGFNEDVKRNFYARRDLGKFAAGGFSIMGAVSDALKREGTSTAALGSSPRLSSPSNPLGLGVYDKAYQRNLNEAFEQHRAIGQTDIKSMGKAAGFVPSFSILGGAEASLVIGTLQGTITNLNNVLAPLTLGYNKQLEAIRRLNVEYSTVAQSIKQGGVAKYGGKTYDASNGNIAQAYRQFVVDFGSKNPHFNHSPSVMNQVEQSYSAYREQAAAKQGKIAQYGNYGMLIGPMAGETAASVAGNFGAPNVQKGLEVFSSGITTAGQVLSAFPNKLGIGLAAGLGIKALGDSISLGVSKFGELQKAFDMASTRAERMAAAGNSVLEAFERLKSASTDASVNLDDFKALQQRHNKAIAELSAVPGGGAILARKLSTATNESDMRKAVAQAVNLANTEKGEFGVKMNLAQAKSQSSMFGVQYQNTFAYSNDVEKLQKQRLLGETSSQLMQSTLDSYNLPKGFEERMRKGALNEGDISTFKNEASKNSVLGGLNKEDADLAIQHLVYELNKFKIPDGVDPNAWAEHIDKLNEISQRELAIRERYNAELQNTLGKGSIITNFVSQQSRSGIESNYRRGQFESFRKEQGANLSSLITSDVSMIGIRGQIKEGQIRGQMKHDLAENLEKGGAGLMTALGATVKEYAGNSGQGGKGAAEKQDARTLSPRHIAQIDYLSKRQEELAKNPSKLLSLAATNNPEKFAEAFIGKKSEVAGGYDKKFTTNEYETLANKLSTTINGQQNHIGEILTATKSITEKGLYDLAMLGKETVNAMKEARFKELSGALKGVDELQRGGARKIRRELRRDEYIVNHSRNDIRRGDAAKELLGFIPSDERDYNNPKIQGLYNTATRGSATAFDYIYGGTGMEQFAHSGERAASRILGNYKGVNMPVEQTFGGEEASPIDTTALENSVNDAARDIERFGQMLRNIGQPLVSLKASMDDATNEKKAEGDKMKPSASDNKEPAGKKVSPFLGGMAEYGVPLGVTLLGLAGMFSGKGKGFTMPKALAFGGAAAGVAGIAGGAGRNAVAAGVAGGAGALAENLGGAGGAGVGAGIITSAVGAAGGTASSIAAGIKNAKTLNFSYLQKLANMQRIGAFTNPEQNSTMLSVIKQMNKGEFSQFSKEIGGTGANLKGRLSGNVAQVYNAEARAALNAPTFQKMLQKIVSGAKVSGSSVGKFLMPEMNSEETVKMIARMSGAKSGSDVRLLNAMMNPPPKVPLKMLPAHGQVGVSAAELSKSVAPEITKLSPWWKNSKYTGTGISGLADLNPLAGFKAAGMLGKTLRVGGILGAGFSGYEAYNQFKNKEYSRGAVNLGSTALSFAGPIGMIGAGVVQGAQAGMDKYRGYKNIEENETLRGQQLDQKNNFLARTQKEARRIASIVPSKRSEEDSQYLERWKGMFGANALQKTETIASKKDAGDFFAKTKTQYMRNLAAPDMTFNKNGKTFGVFGEGNRTWSHAISDESQYHAERQKRYEQVMKDKRYSSYVNSAASQYAAEQTLRQYGEYAPEEAKKYSQQYAKQQAAAQERQEAQQTPKAQKQEVTIEAKPVELSVKLLNQNNEEIQTIQTQIDWLTQAVNGLQGTPKPAAV